MMGRNSRKKYVFGELTFLIKPEFQNKKHLFTFYYGVTQSNASTSTISFNKTSSSPWTLFVYTIQSKLGQDMYMNTPPCQTIRHWVPDATVYRNSHYDECFSNARLCVVPTQWPIYFVRLGFHSSCTIDFRHNPSTLQEIQLWYYGKIVHV